MNLKSIIIFLPIAALIVGFIYLNVVFPKRLEKEEKEKNENKK
jgi:hypothetical protein